MLNFREGLMPGLKYGTVSEVP